MHGACIQAVLTEQLSEFRHIKKTAPDGSQSCRLEGTGEQRVFPEE